MLGDAGASDRTGFGRTLTTQITKVKLLQWGFLLVKAKKIRNL